MLDGSTDRRRCGENFLHSVNFLHSIKAPGWRRARSGPTFPGVDDLPGERRRLVLRWSSRPPERAGHDETGRAPHLLLSPAPTVRQCPPGAARDGLFIASPRVPRPAPVSASCSARSTDLYGASAGRKAKSWPLIVGTYTVPSGPSVVPTVNPVSPGRGSRSSSSPVAVSTTTRSFCWSALLTVT